MPGKERATTEKKHRHRKAELRSLLTKRDLAAIREWGAAERHPMRPLSSLLFDSDELVRWRAIEALGLISAQEWQRDNQRVRRQVRRLYWLMNDESGGICWNAPEAIAEMLYNLPELISEYGIQIPSYFIEEPFERGSRWAVVRLSKRKSSAFAFAAPALAESLKDADGVIRGLSLMALRLLGSESGKASAAGLTSDEHTLTVYDFDSGQFTTTTVAEEARAYLDSL